MKVTQEIDGNRFVLFTNTLVADTIVKLSDLEEFCKIVSKEDHTLVPTSIIEMCRQLNVSQAHWPLLITKSQRTQIIQNLNDRFEQVFSDSENLRYFHSWIKIRQFLDSLSEPIVDKEKWKKIASCTPLVSGSKFRTDAAGHFEKPIFSTSNSTTGRLSIVDGPNFLNAPASTRSAFVPSRKDAKIVYLDFRSMEPRTLLAVSGVSCNVPDVYEEIANSCGIETREKAKLATICALYGASEHLLAESLGGIRQAKTTIENVAKFFNKTKVEQSILSNEIPRNYFGRPLHGIHGNQRLALSHYTQSTAAELSILLFSELCQKIPGIKPWLVIHDALIAEVPDDDYQMFVDTAKDIYFLGTHFSTTITCVQDQL